MILFTAIASNWVRNETKSDFLSLFRFNITGPITGPPDYFCTVVGFGEVSTAPCYESSTTKNMCEKGASISEKAEEERQKTDSSRNLTPSFL